MGLGLGVESSSGGGRNVHRCTGQRSKVKGQSELRNVINYYSRCFKLLSFFTIINDIHRESKNKTPNSWP